MARTLTKCEIGKCRNVGHNEWDIADEESGEVFLHAEGLIYICKKHLLEALEETAERVTKETLDN